MSGAVRQIDLFEQARAGTKFRFVELVERGRDRIQVRVNVLGLGIDEQQARNDFTRGVR